MNQFTDEEAASLKRLLQGQRLAQGDTTPASQAEKDEAYRQGKAFMAKHVAGILSDAGTAAQKVQTIAALVKTLAEKEA